MNALARMTREEIQQRAREIASATASELRLDEPLAPLTSMRVGGPAAALLRPPDAASLEESVRLLSREDVPHLVLGGGSNLLVADEGVDAVVVQASAAAGPAEWLHDGVRAPAGMAMGQLVSEAARRGLSGLEWAAGLPGTLGGAIAGNAGAFGGDTGASVAEVVLLGADGIVRTHETRDGDFAYRRSFVGPGELVLQARLTLTPSTPEAVRDKTNLVNRRRAASQPKGGHSCGCVFKNPQPESAGRLVDQSGLKGLRIGGASISEAHGNFVVNHGNATAADVAALIGMVREEVRRQHGVLLEVEVQAWPSRAALGLGEEAHP